MVERDAPSPAPSAFPTPDTREDDDPGQRVDQNRGRIFPCEECGADLRFDIGEQQLTCPYCGHVKSIDLAEHGEVDERDYAAAVRRARELKRARRRRQESGEDAEAPAAEANAHGAERQLTCEACGAIVRFTGGVVSTDCAFCGQPVQVDAAELASETLAVDGVVPFQVERDRARENLRRWVKSRWFAPNEFRRRGVEGRFAGVYLPCWTYDSLTFSRYTGERGDHHTVTVRDGEKTRTERRTRWTPASGSFQRFFDDVFVMATTALPRALLRKLEPWPLSQCRPYDQRWIAGFLARTYDVDIDEGFSLAHERMESAIRSDVRRRIGGDVQRIHSLEVRHDAIQYKQLLLPVWAMGYRYKDRAYQLVVNAVTGQVQGTRPWSVLKVLFAILAATALAGGIALLQQ